MPLVFHQIGNSSNISADSPPSVERFLQEGLKSQTVLRQEGVLPEKENPYSRALHRREKWTNERKIALRDNPALLRDVLENYGSSARFEDQELFHKPGFPGNREENIFFGYAEHPRSDRDWVAIEVPETATLHDASCRDRGNAYGWRQTAVTIGQFKDMQARAEFSLGWEPRYNEHLIPDRVSPERIIAYAKVEKELPLEQPKITGEDLQRVQKFVNDIVCFAAQFDDPKHNVLIHERNGKYQIRVSLNKEKISGREGEVSSFFDQFKSISQLTEAAKQFGRDREDISKDSTHPQGLVGGVGSSLAPAADGQAGTVKTPPIGRPLAV